MVSYLLLFWRFGDEEKMVSGTGIRIVGGKDDIRKVQEVP